MGITFLGKRPDDVQLSVVEVKELLESPHKDSYIKHLMGVIKHAVAKGREEGLQT